jgi:hypothetical protein
MNLNLLDTRAFLAIRSVTFNRCSHALPSIGQQPDLLAPNTLSWLSLATLLSCVRWLALR